MFWGQLTPSWAVPLLLALSQTSDLSVSGGLGNWMRWPRLLSDARLESDPANRFGGVRIV